MKKTILRVVALLVLIILIAGCSQELKKETEEVIGQAKKSPVSIQTVNK